MRHNTPVFDREFSFPDGQTLVSSTDLKGRLLYCNPAFVAVSGFSADELLGQPHNLIRHPDMPEEAFRDLWETIAAGRPWSGLVKNRRKDGSYYWVMANVTPVLESDEVVGYMSVRIKPSREAVTAAQALYTTMRAEQAAGRTVHRLRGGRVIRNSFSGRLRELAAPDVGARLSAIALASTGVAFAGGVMASGGWSALTSWSATAGAAVVVLAAGLATLTVRALTLRPLDKLLAFSNRMAACDLTQRIEDLGPGVFGQLAASMNQLNVNLQAVVGDARSEVDNMHLATAHIAGGNRDLSARTESQAASLEETVASVEQITGTVGQTAASAQEAARLALDASDVTRSSSAAVEAVFDTMGKISASSLRIGEIITVIESIAFQTNILALNAAVEAARAGEQGRGFAVVASEVRALAQHTAEAAKEVKSLVEASGQTVQCGTRQAETARDTMENALQAVTRVSHVIRDISLGAKEQLQGISQINDAMGQLDAITQQNAALVQQIATSAVDLERRAQTVSSSVAVFKMEGHETGPAQPDAVALRRAARTQAKA